MLSSSVQCLGRCNSFSGLLCVGSFNPVQEPSLSLEKISAAAAGGFTHLRAMVCLGFVLSVHTVQSLNAVWDGPQRAEVG